MKKIKLNPGICGLVSLITVDGDGDTEVNITVETQCKNVQKMVEALDQPLDAYEVCFCKPGTGEVYEAAENLIHGACPFPSALLKCIEAEAGLALPKNVSFEFVES